MSASLIHVGGSGLMAGEAKGFGLPCVMGEFLLLQPRDLKKKKPNFAHFIKCQVYYDSSSFILLLAGSLPLRLLKY